MTALPTIRVMRDDGKGYHIVNAPEVCVGPDALVVKADAVVDALEASVAAKPPAKSRKAKK